MISKNQLEFYNQYLNLEKQDLKLDELEAYHLEGHYTDFSDEQEYHKFFGLSQSALQNFIKSPWNYFYKKYVDKKGISGYHLDLGTYLHSLILEPHRIDEFYHDEDIIKEILEERPSISNPRSTKEYKAWVKQKEDSNAGILIKKEQIEEMQEMVANIYEHQDASYLLSNGLKEKALLTYSKDYDLFVRGKLDCFSVDQGWVLDVKKVQSVSSDDFSKDIFNKNYFLQVAFYKMLFELKFKKPMKKFYWIISESNKPFECEVYEASQNVINSGKMILEFLLSEIKECYKNKNFKIKKSRKVIDLPSWSEKKLDNLLSEKHFEKEL